MHGLKIMIMIGKVEQHVIGVGLIILNNQRIPMTQEQYNNPDLVRP